MPLSVFIGSSKKCAFYEFFVALGAGDARALGLYDINTMKLD
jgi:hypothetical protein